MQPECAIPAYRFFGSFIWHPPPICRVNGRRLAVPNPADRNGQTSPKITAIPAPVVDPSTRFVRLRRHAFPRRADSISRAPDLVLPLPKAWCCRIQRRVPRPRHAQIPPRLAAWPPQHVADVGEHVFLEAGHDYSFSLPTGAQRQLCCTISRRRGIFGRHARRSSSLESQVSRIISLFHGARLGGS